MKIWYEFTKRNWYDIAKIIDNEYVGKLDNFTYIRKKGYMLLGTDVCDFAVPIKVYTDIYNTINRITRLSLDPDESYVDIHDETYNKISKYLVNL